MATESCRYVRCSCWLAGRVWLVAWRGRRTEAVADYCGQNINNTNCASNCVCEYEDNTRSINFSSSPRMERIYGTGHKYRHSTKEREGWRQGATWRCLFGQLTKPGLPVPQRLILLFLPGEAAAKNKKECKNYCSESTATTPGHHHRHSGRQMKSSCAKKTIVLSFGGGARLGK